MTTLRITTRNARFQQWHALLDNRTKRTRTGEFVVQGVRPITLALRYGWTIRALIHPIGRSLSDWANGVLADAAAGAGEWVATSPDGRVARVGMSPERAAMSPERVSKSPGRVETRPELVAMAPELFAELAGKDEDVPELLAIVARRPDRLDRIPVGPDFLGVVFDRPVSPGNVGTVIRSADAFGAAGVIIAGHGADPYDPKAVRAATGSLFALPVVRVPAPGHVLDWLTQQTDQHIQVVGTDETGRCDIADHDLTGPTLLVVGNETTGMSAAWQDACDVIVRIPIGGGASSLNAATAASVVLYEATRQRARG